MAQILAILPKLNAYQFKSPEEKTRIETNIKSNIESLIAKGMSIVMLREDMLALELFGTDKRIQWITSFTERDTSFMFSCVSDYPVVYQEINPTQCSQTIMDKLKVKIKTVKATDYHGDMGAYMLARLNSLQDKISLTIKLLTQQYKNIIEFRGTSNYCDPAVPSAGDGRLIIVVDTISTVTVMYYGGCAIEANQMNQILEVL